MCWIKDDAGDLINLEHVEAIMVSKIDPDSQQAPEGHTHELLAVNPAQESYRLFSGNLEAVTEHRLNIQKELLRYQQFLLT